MKQLSQFSNDSDLVMTEDTASITVASKPELLDELAARGTDLIAISEGLESLRATLEIPAEIQIGITFIRVEDAAELDVAKEFMADNPDTLGFCFSNGSEVDGKDTLEVFVAIDPTRVPQTEHELTDDLVENTVDLNHYLISQIIMALDPDDEGTDADTELTEEEIDAYEEEATEVLNQLLEAETPPFAIVPHDEDDEDEA